MKKVIVFMLVFLLITSTNLISANSEERECKETCTIEKRDDVQECRNNYRECRNTCTSERKNCIDFVKSVKIDCNDACDSILDRKEKSSCKRSCSLNYSKDVRDCRSRICYTNCREENTACKDLTKVKNSLCRNTCLPVGQAPFNFILDEQTCVDNGGFYQQLCKGPYFGISCSSTTYCQCSGFANFTCPQNYTCVKDFGITVRGRSHSIPGWRSTLGQDLGPIGLCGQPI